MKSLYKILIVCFFIICLGIAAHAIYYYNYLTDLRFNVLTEKSKVSTAIQYRRNLAPMIIESVASLVEHEDNVFNRTVDARERALTGNTALSDELGKSKKLTMQNLFNKILAIGEQYPSLVTSEAFQLMMKQVADAEEKILVLRTSYNDAVNVYTTAMSMFPGNIYTKIFVFPSFPYFTDQEESEWAKSEIIEVEQSRIISKKLYGKKI